MRELYDVIQTPVVTEKSAKEMETQNLYTFIVDERANTVSYTHLTLPTIYSV